MGVFGTGHCELKALGEPWRRLVRIKSELEMEARGKDRLQNRIQGMAK